jgi:hypothetical protein
LVPLPATWNNSLGQSAVKTFLAGSFIGTWVPAAGFAGFTGTWYMLEGEWFFAAD